MIGLSRTILPTILYWPSSQFTDKAINVNLILLIGGSLNMRGLKAAFIASGFPWQQRLQFNSDSSFTQRQLTISHLELPTLQKSSSVQWHQTTDKLKRDHFYRDPINNYFKTAIEKSLDKLIRYLDLKLDIAAPKSWDRVRQKIESHKPVLDMFRCQIIVPMTGVTSGADYLQFIAKKVGEALTQENLNIFRQTDNYTNPKPSGYRDYKLNISLDVPGHGRVFAEVKIISENYLASDGFFHKLYESRPCAFNCHGRNRWSEPGSESPGYRKADFCSCW